MNMRMFAIVAISTIVIVFICVGMAAVYLPAWQIRVGERQMTQTEAVAVAQAETDVNQRTETAAARALQTQRANESTATAAAATQAASAAAQTQAAVPTSTPTPTLAPLPIACTGTIVGTDHNMYPVPGGGRRNGAELLPKTASVDVIGGLQDGGWYFVRHDDKEGWLRSDFLSLAGCKPRTYDLSYLLHLLKEDNKLVLDETFAGNANNWIDQDSKPLNPDVTDYGDSYIELRGIPGLALAKPQIVATSKLSDFELFVSFMRKNNSNPSFVGVRIRDSGSNFYDIRILGDCSLEVYATNDQFFKRDVNPGPVNNCRDEFEDYLTLTVKGYDLTVAINDSGPISVTLRDPNGVYTAGDIVLEASQTIVDYTYLVITAPR